MNQQTGQAPLKEFRAGAVRASVWRREVPTSDNARTIVQHSVRIQKRYRDAKNGEWKDTEYYFQNDLPKLALVVRKAYEYVTLVETDDAEDFPPTGR